MSMDMEYRSGGTPTATRDGAADKRHRVMVSLNEEQMAAVEGWRMAHGIADQAEALGELVRLALLGEIAKIYRLVSDARSSGKRNRRGADEA